MPASSAQDSPELRRCALAVSVLWDVDLCPGEDGLILTGSTPVAVSWVEVRRVLAGADPGTPRARERLAGCLRPLRWLADAAPETLPDRARPLALPVGHVAHPGASWVRRAVLGGAVELGLAVVGLDPDDPDTLVPVPWMPTLASARVDAACWAHALSYLHQMGTLAATRTQTDPTTALAPLGDCDVVTLLSARIFRAALVGEHGGMCALALPMRTRGWTDFRRVDAAFAVAAAAATDPIERGFSRPLLVTMDEVVMVADRGAPTRIVLDEAVPTRSPQPG